MRGPEWIFSYVYPTSLSPTSSEPGSPRTNPQVSHPSPLGTLIGLKFRIKAEAMGFAQKGLGASPVSACYCGYDHEHICGLLDIYLI
jgi:hypothetical protein